MALTSGHYAPVVAKKVTHWPKPDANGDGEQVWEDQYDGQGNLLGRQAATDSQGRPVRHYSAPEGFINVPSKEAGGNGVTENYVKANERGGVWRHPVTGEARGIKPGQTLVELPDGSHHYLEDDFSRYLFEQWHEPTDAPADRPEVVRPKTDADRSAEEEEAVRQFLQDRRARLKEQEG